MPIHPQPLPMRAEIERHVREIQRRIRPMYRPMMIRAQQRQVGQGIFAAAAQPDNMMRLADRVGVDRPRVPQA